MRPATWFLAVLVGVQIASAGVSGLYSESRERLRARDALVATFEETGPAATPEFLAALDSPDDLMRRTAAHLLVRLGQANRQAFRKALRDDDPRVRLIALQGLAELGFLEDYWSVVLLDEDLLITSRLTPRFLADHPLPEGDKLETIVQDLSVLYRTAEEDERLRILQTSVSKIPPGPAMRTFLLLATGDPSAKVREVAFRRISEIISPDWEQAGTILSRATEDDSPRIRREIAFELDRQVNGVETVEVNPMGWLLRVEDAGPEAAQAWSQPEEDGSGWTPGISVHRPWTRSGLAADGKAVWARNNFRLPAVENWKRATLRILGAAKGENLHVWINGTPVGQANIDPGGLPLQFDVTRSITAGSANTIAVRVQGPDVLESDWQQLEIVFFRQ